MSLNLVNKRCLVVGGGKVAERKVLSLLEAGASVVVISPELTTDLDRIREEGRLGHVARAYRQGDLAGAFLVIAATDDSATNQAAAAEAEARGVLVNVVDDPFHSVFTLPAVLRRGDLVVSIATNGRSPAMAGYIRDALEKWLPPEYATLLELAAEVRAELRAQGESVPGERWHHSLTSDLLALIRSGDHSAARSELLASLTGKH